MTVSGEQSVMMNLTTMMPLSPATVSATGQQIIGSVDCITRQRSYEQKTRSLSKVVTFFESLSHDQTCRGHD